MYVLMSINRCTIFYILLYPKLGMRILSGFFSLLTKSQLCRFFELLSTKIRQKFMKKSLKKCNFLLSTKKNNCRQIFLSCATLDVTWALELWGSGRSAHAQVNTVILYSKNPWSLIFFRCDWLHSPWLRTDIQFAVGAAKVSLFSTTRKFYSCYNSSHFL